TSEPEDHGALIFLCDAYSRECDQGQYNADRDDDCCAHEFPASRPVQPPCFDAMARILSGSREPDRNDTWKVEGKEVAPRLLGPGAGLRRDRAVPHRQRTHDHDEP